jgi:hypothetical protein
MEIPPYPPDEPDRITLMCDTVVDTNGFRLTISDGRYTMHPDDWPTVANLKRQLEAATKSCDDLNVQCRFWRQCAEHAVTGWNKLEDEHEAMKDTLRELARALGMTPIVDDAPEAG